LQGNLLGVDYEKIPLLADTDLRGDYQAIVAKSIVYARSGGNLPTGFSEGTTFSCPDLKTIRSDLQQLFILEGDSK
ncbi:MAG: hypothetical protein K2Y31_10880, partial [Burkholderiales bacterium]|nr:hypothetical protein [Burkholderiales bacterium]